jgi:phospholipase/carboxylesterase
MSLVYDVVGRGSRWVVVLHGLGDSKEGWKPVAPMLGLDDVGWIFVQAPDPYGPGWAWFDLSLDKPRVDRAGVERSRAALLDLLATLESERGIPCERIILMGFSQGCLMALDVALRHPRRFAAVVGLSGWVFDEQAYPAALGVPQRIFQAHGRFDGVIPVEMARPQAQRLQALGVDLTWAEYDVDHGLDPDEEVTDLRAFLR